MHLTTKLNGESIALDSNNILGSGGEAKVFAVHQKPNLVAKIYHKPTQKRAKKLELMLANPPGDPMASTGHISIAWPTDLLQTQDPTPKTIGFLMLNISGMSTILNFYNPQIRRQKCPLFNYKYLHRAARNLATAVNALHNRGYVIGDINESNIFVSDSALVTIVDTDSFQVTDPNTGTIHRCPVGKPEYTPPELQGVSFAKVDRNTDHDLFGMAVLIFQLLMEGFHPFTGLYNGSGDPPAIEDRIASGHFPYRKKWLRPYEPSPHSPDLNILHPHIQRLVMQCFESGYKKPKKRPDAQTWIDALIQSEDALIECTQNKQHLYGKHLRHCPWCERAQELGGRDPFPSSQTIHKGLPKPIAAPKQKPIAPLQSQSSSSSSIDVTGQPKNSKKWMVGVVLFFLGAWLLTKVELPSIPWPQWPTWTSEAPTLQEPEPKQKPEPQPETTETKITREPEPKPEQNPLPDILQRFQALDNPNVTDADKLRLFSQFINDFYNHPDATKYVTYVKDRWEALAYAQMKFAYQDFQAKPSRENIQAVLNKANDYLQHQSKRQSVATYAQRFAKWHLNNTPHPLRLIIDQKQKLYTHIIHNNTIYADTKKMGAFASITIPNYKLSDSLKIEGYQDDRFDDTKLSQTLTINNYKGNHHLTLSDPRGIINIQVIFEDYPTKPPL